ncbi:MAG: hypothetical protein EON60_03790 [Alphaproteobacteria bacterium]|nr:MAG: hypothetical protein EON60_03790 [Alphaproteobacteria bacterium]
MKNMMMGVSALALMASAAQAQNAERTGQAVMATEVLPAGERMATEHAPMGIRAGSFLVIPKVELTETFNDNIYATSDNEESDLVTSIRPEVSVRSNWNRHAVNALARAEVKRYADNGSEDHENYLVAADGRLDVLRDTSIGGGLSYAQDHEDRGDPNTIGSPDEPTKYNTTVARIGAYRGLGKVNARVDSEAKKLDYKDSTSTAGTNIDNDVRDRMEYTQSLRVGYQLTRQFEVFGRGAWDNRVYDNKSVARSNNGQTYTAGASFDLSGKTKGEVYAGYMSRSYGDNARESINEPTFGGKVTWNATDLTSVIGSINRGIEETTIGASSGFLSTDYDLGVEHALTRDILLKGNVGYTNNEYQGAGFQREDDIMTAGAGVDYWLNRCLKAGLSYNLTDRDSNVSGGDYLRNTVMLKLTATY